MCRKEIGIYEQGLMGVRLEIWACSLWKLVQIQDISEETDRGVYGMRES